MSTVVAGWLMSKGFRHFRSRVGGVHSGPIDTIFTVCALAFLATAVLAPTPARSVVVAHDQDADRIGGLSYRRVAYRSGLHADPTHV